MSGRIGRPTDCQAPPTPSSRSTHERARARIRRVDADVDVILVDDCSRDRTVEIARELGITVASVAYRLAPEHRFPAATDDCMGRAQAQGLTPDEKNNETGRRAAQGAATAGVAAAVGALVTGHNTDGVIRAGAAGVAVGGSAGAVSGAMSERPNTTYRNYVHRCLADKGFQVIGWN